MKSISRVKSKNRGFTLLETLTTSFLTVMILTGGVTAMLFGMSSWMRGEGKMGAQTQAQNATRTICKELREAMTVTVADNGRSITYRLPSKDESGSYIAPAVWDNVSRTIVYNSDTGKVSINANGASRVVCSSVIPYEYNTSANTLGGTYRVFTAGPGAITRQVTVQLVTRRNEYRTENQIGRRREVVYVRNVPMLTR